MRQYRLFLLTALTMIAFASNSLLNRMALAGEYSDAMAFATLRLASGAVALALLCFVFHGGLRLFGAGRVAGVAALLVYIFGFSVAYNALDAGIGALVLFGMVQVTMFASAWQHGETIAQARWGGLILAVIGLTWLMWPGADAKVSLLHGGVMALAGIAWGVYSLVGRKTAEPLQATAANFVLAVPLGVVFWLLVSRDDISMSGIGIILAITSGAVTSGLGYALWYTVLPHLQSSAAAVAQLSAPVIAILAGVALLGEVLTWQLAVASGLVLGGVAISSLAGKR